MSITHNGKHAATSVLVAVLMLTLGVATLACSRPPDEERTPSYDWTCRPLAAVVGPEDFVIDAEHQRLLVSSQDRRTPNETGSIVAVWPATGARRTLPLRNRGACSFHPHGMTLVPTSPPRLYVINHHEAIDATTERSCFPSGAGGRAKARTSVEVFSVYPHELRFVQRLADSALLTNANDLDADHDGNLYITVPPASGLGIVAERLWPEPKSKVVSFACLTRQDDGTCLGKWTEIARVGRFVNGIALIEAGENPRLVVSTSIDSAIVPLERARGTWHSLPERSVGASHDNLMWLDTEKTTLLVASHPNLRRLLQHAASPRAASPSTVWTVPLDPSVPAAEVFKDDGSTISGISTAACFDGRLILGQIFGHELLTCQLPHLCSASAQPTTTPEAHP